MMLMAVERDDSYFPPTTTISIENSIVERARDTEEKKFDF